MRSSRSALAMATGVDRGAGARGARDAASGAKGRLELVGEHNGAAIFVDYAHKPGALEDCARSRCGPMRKNKLIVVFGCGGDRDKGKRPMMGEVATRARRPRHRHRRQPAHRGRGDHPRRDPGRRARRRRRSATAARRSSRAVKSLKPGDVLLIAGKGHEDYQIVGTTKHHFSDHEVVAEALEGL